ncbi:MAG: 16S rRNA (guanine(966)-N(2))-methyltransferase RsmD [Verrucomicrobia bacterium]|nr:16S rRNA (guanine(966)-N(2))-methyltransferase RsmD [Verrucomicrobiota bacterium]
MRVVAGQLRGRKLKAPDGVTTRPTADRARQGLFAVLGEVSGLRVADLYAGTGALGIEALSRGAASTVFVESARAAVTVLRANLEQLGLDEHSAVLPLALERARHRLLALGPFDLVLCDPPWADMASATRSLQTLVDSGLLADSATLAVEHRREDSVTLSGTVGLWQLRHWGDTAFSFFAAGGR